jgi:hypothetical protein
MPVNKFGESDYTNSTGTSGVSLSQVNANFLRRDGSNTATRSLNMDSNKITELANPVADNDAATKAYVDTRTGVSKLGDTMTGELHMSDNKITGLHLPTDKSDATNKQYVDVQNKKQVAKTGDIVTGDLRISMGSDLVRTLGCLDLSAARKFIIALGNRENNLFLALASHSTPTPVTLETTDGFLVKAGKNICQFAREEIDVFKDITMNDNKIVQLSDPVDDQDAATKKYVDNKQFLCHTGHIPPMSSNTSQTGFRANASSFLNAGCQPYMAFAPQLPDGSEWVSANDQPSGQYLEIRCPSKVTIWKISLRGRSTNTGKISNWRLLGANHDFHFTNLLSSDTVLDSTTKEFLVDATEAYSIYRIQIVQTEPKNPGISHFQIFTKCTQAVAFIGLLA